MFPNYKVHNLLFVEMLNLFIFVSYSLFYWHPVQRRREMGIEYDFILSHPQLIRRGPQGRIENRKIPKL